MSLSFTLITTESRLPAICTTVISGDNTNTVNAASAAHITPAFSHGAWLAYNYMIITQYHITDNKPVYEKKPRRFSYINTPEPCLGVIPNKYGLLHRGRRTKGKSIYSPKICRAFEKSSDNDCSKIPSAKPRRLARTNGRGSDISSLS